jgi:diguanylate cyclase (GGDEF)-like protein/PAS domain S-box-containing protein
LSLIKNFRSGKYLNNLSLVDFDGRVVFQSDNNTPIFSESQELRLSLNLAQTVTYLNKTKKEIVFIVPIKYYDTTQGAVVATYDFKNIVDKYNKNENFIYTKIMNSSLEYYSKNYMHEKSYHKYRLLDNSDYKIFYNVGIMLEMGIDEEVYLQPLHYQILVLAIIGFFILLIGALISYLIAINITTPILTLVTKVKRSSSADMLAEYQSLGTEDELDELGYAFYTKEKELDDLNKNLQVKVKEATKELEIEKNRFALAIEGTQDGLWDWDLTTDELFFSERFETMLGYNEGDLPKRIDSWFGLLHPDDIDLASKVVQEYLDTKGEGFYENSFRLRAKDGSWKWILGRGRAQFDKNEKPLRFVGFNTDITEQKEYQKNLDHTAKHDSLTHLPNRFLLSELLTHAMHIVKRNHKQLALLFIDLDGFKEINDVYGHDAGDEVLFTVASRMNALVRESDIVSRLGGDEFVIVFTDLNKSKEVIPMLQRLISELASSIKYNEHNMHVSASIGVSFYPQSTDIGNEVLLRQADQAMYNAKSAGKNQYQFFNIEASDELKENQKNITSLHQAIKTNQLVLHYQPKVDMKHNKVVGLEALLRWNHPEKGILYPDDFLPLIEQDSNLMIELGKWVFENAFCELESWHLQGLDIMLNINVSSYEVQQQDFSLYLKKLFDKYQGIKANTIEIELLETAAFDNFELTSKTLKECQKLGVSIAVDDFGTGYASLHYLKKLPMNTLKIDKSFVIDLLHTSSSISIIEASVGLAHAFNVDVVAEGVESEEHGKILLKLGCEIAQGYVIAKAMPAHNIIDWVASYKGFSSWAKIVPVNNWERTILYASVEHRSWLYSVENFIRNNKKSLPQLDASSCYLGRWIKDSASKNLLNPEFERLEALHLELHNYAEKLLLSNKNDKLVGIKKLKNLHKEILKKLELLTVN